MCEIGQIRNTQDLPAAIIPVGIKQREIPKVMAILVNQPLSAGKGALGSIYAQREAASEASQKGKMEFKDLKS